MLILAAPAWSRTGGNDTSVQRSVAPSGVARIPLAAQSAISASLGREVDPFVQQAKLTAGDGAAGDLFGLRVAVSADTIAVAAPARTVGTTIHAGAVYVFQKPASGWAQLTAPSAILTVANAPEGAVLGGSLAISSNGDTIVAGADGRTVGTKVAQGAVYVFVKPPSGWKDATQTAELTASDGDSKDGLGAAVAISGDTIVAGPDRHDVDARINEGEAYVFVKPAGGWANGTESQILDGADSGAGDLFGRSVAISGSTIVVGAPHHTVAGADRGSAYLYTNGPAGFTQTTELTVAGGALDDQFGTAVALSGDTVFVGAPRRQVDLIRRGAAYVFVKPFDGWSADASQTAEVAASDGADGDLFGEALVASGDSVLIGAGRHQVGANALQGAAYLFTKPAGTWTSEHQTEELTASDGAAGDLFGISVGLSGDLAVVGGVPTIAGNLQQGAVYLYGAPATPAIAISTPANGATYTQNSIIPASFSCSAPAGVAITSCTAPTRDGAPIATSTLGQHSFTVTAIGSDGGSATQTSSYTIVAQAQRGPSALRLSAVRQSAPVWRLGRSQPRTARRRAPVGTTFSFALSEAARVTLSFTQASSGRIVRGTCAMRTVKNTRHPRCTRMIAAGTLTLNAHDGLNRVLFQGRLAHRRTLRPGRYAMAITATSAAGERASSPPLHFTITK